MSLELGCASDGNASNATLRGLGNYRIFGHWVADDCSSHRVAVDDERCIGLVPQLDGIWLQDCVDVAQESLGLNIDLLGSGPTYATIRHQPQVCEEYCSGGRSDQCSDNCLGDRSCNVATEVFSATHDLVNQTLHLVIERYAAEFELAPGASCTSEMVEDFQINAQCVERDAY
ncbi:MAG TPA: hypothetical protein VIV60_00975, partial [Polyangiaceae bacterium]